MCLRSCVIELEEYIYIYIDKDGKFISETSIYKMVMRTRKSYRITSNLHLPSRHEFRNGRISSIQILGGHIKYKDCDHL